MRASRAGPAALCAAAALLSACTQWRTVPAPSPRAFAVEQEVQVWRGGRSVLLSAVVVTADSVLGTRGGQTRFAVAWTEVDSLRVAERDHTTPVIVGLLALAALVVVLFAQAIGQGVEGS